MFDTRYAFMSAYIKGEESKIITVDYLDNLLRASSVQDALGIIRETDVGNYLEALPIETFVTMDQNLWHYFGDSLERLKWYKPVPIGILSILDAYIEKYDVLNIKAALQSIVTSRSTNMMPLGLLHDNGKLEELSQAENIDTVISILNKTELNDYAIVLDENRTDETIDEIVLSQGRLDVVYYRKLLAAVKKISDSALLTKAFGMMIDMVNLGIIIRAIVSGIGEEVNESIIDGGYIITGDVARDLVSLPYTDMLDRLEDTPYRELIEELRNSFTANNSVVDTEQIIDKHKFRLIKEILAPNVLSPVMMAWYLVLKEIEIRDLRIILKAMFDNVPLEEIRSYLVLSS